MKSTRKRSSADFMAEVALEAIRGDLAVAELTAKHGVHHTMMAASAAGHPQRRGFLYLVAIMDWARKVRAWRLSNTMDQTREEAGRLEEPSVRRAVGARSDHTSANLHCRPSPLCCAMPRSASAWTVGGRWMDNGFIERLKYECVHLHASRPVPSCGMALVGGLPNSHPASALKPGWVSPGGGQSAIRSWGACLP